MKAAVCYEAGAPLVVETLRLDPPQADEVRVRIAACAICYSDIHYLDGAWPDALPAVYGHEAAGVVEAVGPGVEALAPGTPVVVSLLRECGHCGACGEAAPYLCEGDFPLDRASRLFTGADRPVRAGLHTGGFAEAAVVHRSQVAPLPADMPLASAALLACGVITGLGAVTNTADVRAGGSVVVIGTGGVGLNSIQGAVLRRAGRIIAVDLSADKLAAARAFGATDTVNALDDDPVEAVRALTGGRGAGYVFVTVGAVRAMQQGLAMLARGGALVLVGMPPAGVELPFDPSALAGAGQRILGSKMGSTRFAEEIPRLVALYRAGALKLDELVSATYPLARINEAIAATKAGEGLRNVVVMDGAA